MFNKPSDKVTVAYRTTGEHNISNQTVANKCQFSHEAVLAGAKRFLERAGYKLLTPVPGGLTTPDLYAHRREGHNTFIAVGLVCDGLEQASDGFARLSKMQVSIGEGADYILVMPPVNEYPVIQFFTAEKGKWFYEVKKFRFMMWLCNPERDAVWCIAGSARDRLLETYFVNGYHPIDQYISMLLSREWMKEGEF